MVTPLLDDRQVFYAHIDEHHGGDIDAVCGTDLGRADRATYLSDAVSSKERARWPCAGLAVSRRA